MRMVCRAFIVLACVVALPAWASAQASITGIVKDTSGAVLPGVTVEAASPVLIEKVRSAVTDGSGQYRIVDLRAGTYAVTFTLTGFSTVQARRHRAVGHVYGNRQCRHARRSDRRNHHGHRRDPGRGRSERAASGHDWQRRVELHPHRTWVHGHHAVDSCDPDAGFSPVKHAVNPRHGCVWHRGGRNGNEGRLQVDGLGVGAARNGGGVSGYNADVANAQEITFTVSAGLGEAEVWGPALSVVPKTGGNAFRGSVYLAGVSSGMVGNNYTPELQAAGSECPWEAAQVVGLHRRPRRSDQEGPAVVLPQFEKSGKPYLRPVDVCQCERWRPVQVDLLGGSEPSIRHGWQLVDREPAPDGASLAAQQIQRLLG